MFGYVKPVHSELRLREYECYRAYYCGVCRAMGKCTGQCSRMTLSYDIVFLAAVRCALTGEAPEIRKLRCLPHPFRRRKAVVNSPQLNYCADASALLSYRKLQDDLCDERGLRRLRARLGMLFLSSAYRKAQKRHTELDQFIGEALSRLQAYEKDGSAQPSADLPADIFGEIMQRIFTEDLDGTAARLGGEIGRTLGRWIYLTDAADDFVKDRKHGRFNPYLRLMGSQPTPSDWSGVRVALTAILTQTERAFLLMDDPNCPELKEILANILYLGLPQAAKTAVDAAEASDANTPEQADSDRKGDNQ